MEEKIELLKKKLTVAGIILLDIFTDRMILR